MSEERVAVVFPGQGSQRAGMGERFFMRRYMCRATYEEASDALGWDVAALCFDDDERLHLTTFTQPCILTTEIAMLRAIQTMYDFHPTFFGGHSLGEFTALVAAGALPFRAAVWIVHERGRLMQEATPVGFGAMTAVIAERITEEELSPLIADLPIDLANINSLRQIVISGEAAHMGRAEERIRDTFTDRSVRLVRLNVSAPFHSRFMRVIADAFGEVLEKQGPGIAADQAQAVTSNFTGTFHQGTKNDLKRSLTAQLGHPVRWRDNMMALTKEAGEVYEIGPGRPLREFFKTEGRDCRSITSIASAEKAFQKENG